MAPHAAAIDVTVTSLLNSTIIMEVGMCSGVAARAAEFHSENDTKRGESGWKCIPLVGIYVESHGAWSPEALNAISQLGHSWECL